MTTERAQKLREVIRQALYQTPNDKECEVPIVVAALREVVFQLQYYQFGDGEDMVVSSRGILDLCDELERVQ